jgi:hypothetical protein
MFFSGPSKGSISLSSSTVELDLGNFQTFKVKFHTDNWGQNYVTERIDVTNAEFLNPGVGLVYRKTSSYIDFLDCSYYPVYGGSSEVILTGYHITLADGTIVEEGTGYNMNNRYGGRLGLRTIWASVDIGGTSVYLDDEYVGYIREFFPSGIVCDKEGALNVFHTRGSSHLTAESSKGYKWDANITFSEGICST